MAQVNKALLFKKENKDLLLKDLCYRLPYGVKVQNQLGGINRLGIGNADLTRLYNNDFGIYSEKNLSLPYLFPLSSMTEEQKKELKYLCDWENDRWSGLVVIHENEFCMNTKIFDWLNKNHFDYRCLIEKGLAIDATGLNIY